MKSYLSYYINESTPIYGGKKSIFIDHSSQIVNGDSSNSKYLKIPNHAGTHIDFPNHFSDHGKIINDYPASFWKFKDVYIILGSENNDIWSIRVYLNPLVSFIWIGVFVMIFSSIIAVIKK